jgi:hypothetical protein
MDEVDVRIRVRSVSRAGRYKVVSGSCGAVSHMARHARDDAHFQSFHQHFQFPPKLKVLFRLDDINTAVKLGTSGTYQVLPFFLIRLLLGNSTVLLIIIFLFGVS